MAYTGPTSGFAAGAQTNNTLVDIALESVWNQAPATNYQRIRITGETIRKTKSRARPEEINAVPEDAQAVTQQESVTGDINAALSFGTFDDLLAGAIDNDWSLFQVTSTASGGSLPISVLAPPADLTTGFGLIAPAGTFSAWPTIGTVRIGGVANSVTNPQALLTPGIYLYQIVNANGLLLYPTSSKQTVVAGTMPSGVKLTSQNMRNGAVFKSFTVRVPMLGRWRQATGGYVSKATISLAQNAFATTAFTFLFGDQQAVTNDVSTGVTAAPSNYVIDNVKGFVGVFVNFKAATGKVRQASVTVSSTGASQDYAMGQGAAVGIQPGSFGAGGQVQFLFNSWAEYDAFEAETSKVIQIVDQDAAGNYYAYTFLNATFQNPQVNADAKNKTVMATYDIEANPLATGGTFQIDRCTSAV